VRRSYPQKQENIDVFKEKVQRSSLMILTDYRGSDKGLTVDETNILRRKIREKSGEYKVFKNTLARRALNDLSITGLDQQLENPTAFAFAYKDPVEVAKAIVDFAKTKRTTTNPDGVPIMKIGYMDGQIFDYSGLVKLASLPSKEVLLSRLVGSIKAPLTQFHTVLTEPMAKLVRVLKAISTK